MTRIIIALVIFILVVVVIAFFILHCVKSKRKPDLSDDSKIHAKLPMESNREDDELI